MANKKKELQFTQPDKKVHVYNSVASDATGSIEGYTIEGNRETKQWSVTLNGEPVGEPAASRPAAAKVATDHAFPDQAAEAASSGEEAPKPKLNGREYAVLTAVKGTEGGADVLKIAEITQLPTEAVMSSVSTLGRRGLIRLSGLTSTITEQGEEAYANYVPGASLSGPRRAGDPATEAARREARAARVRTKPGFNEETMGYLLEPISELEMTKLKLELARVSLTHSMGIHRMYPLAKGLDERVQNNREKVAELEKAVETLEAGGTLDKPTKGSETETEAPAAE